MTFRLLCDAIPFCYGPGAALDAFLGALLASLPETPHIDILATGTTHELLSRTGHPVRLLPIDSEDPKALATVPFGAYDAFFNVCNPASFGAARASGIPTVYLDFLLWMHHGPAPDYFEADLYLAENYPGTTEWIERYGGGVRNLLLIPPLVAEGSERRPIPGSLLIGLGGLYSRMTTPGTNTNYAPLVLKQVLDALPAGRFSRVLIAGPSGIADTVRATIGNRRGVEYASLSHEQFLGALAESEVFVSHPGLYGAFEGMLTGVPTAFLPPSNYTQILQLRNYRTRGIAPFSFSWEDAGLDGIPGDLPEADGIRAVLRLVAEAERTPHAVAALRKSLADFFLLDGRALDELGAAQKRLTSQYGLGGPRYAAERFLEWLASAPRWQAIVDD
jgi:hypothetical protein